MTNTLEQETVHRMVAAYLAACTAQDAAGCASAYTENATLVSPWDPPLVGRKAIEKAHSGWFEEGERNKTMTIMDLEISGDLAACLMAFSAEIPAETGGVEPSHGTSLNTLKRGPDGTWLISRCFLHMLDTPLQ